MKGYIISHVVVVAFNLFVLYMWKQ